MYSYHREYERIERSQTNNSTDRVWYRNTCYVTALKSYCLIHIKGGGGASSSSVQSHADYTVTTATSSIP